MCRHWLIFIWLSLSTAASATTEPADTSLQLHALRSEIQSLNRDLDKNKSTKKNLFAQLKKQNRRISTLNKALYELKQEIQRVSNHLSVLRRRVMSQSSSKKQQLEALEKQIRSAYMQSQPSLLKILLNQNDPALLAREHRYFYYFNLARQQQLHDINRQLANLSQEQKALFSQQKTLRALYQQQQQKQQKLNQQMKKRQITLTLLDKKISSQSARLNQLHQQEQSLQALLDNLDRQPTKSTFSFAHSTGRLPWPLKGKLLAHYGHSRNIGKLHWQGILIGAPSGQEVRAVAPGKIVFADWLRGFGLLIIIDHGHQYMTLYGYNKALLKQTGEFVSAGDIIALSGDNGQQKQAGLYFEVRYKGSPTNPLVWLRKQG